jgi:hypothetical protein
LWKKGAGRGTTIGLLLLEGGEVLHVLADHAHEGLHHALMVQGEGRKEGR